MRSGAGVGVLGTGARGRVSVSSGHHELMVLIAAVLSIK